MIKTSDGTQIKRLSGKLGDRQPALGGRKQRALYTALGGETSIDLSLLTPSLSYTPSANQISIKRTSGGNPISGIDFYERTPTSIGFPTTDPLIAGEVVEVVLDFGITSVMALAPRPDCYSQTATTGQTLITADFSWTYNLNPSKAIGGVRVEINGITQTRGVDFTEVNLGTANTNQVILVDALLGGENLILTPAYQALDTSSASTSFYGQAYSNMQSTFAAGTQAFVDQSSDMITVPNTTINKRAKIPNLANDLRASLGIDRVMILGVSLLQSEYGSSGEPVYAPINDDRGLIRFVGDWLPTIDVAGQRIYSSNTASYAEITFYGTGLNLITIGGSGTTWDFRATVDGGSESGNLMIPSTAPVAFVTRGYSVNWLVPVTANLTLGIHTVKIRVGAAINILGFEILNSNASGLVNINSGVGYLNGQKYTNLLADSVTYNTGVTGTKGGRIVRYLNSDGTVGQAFTATNASAAYLASADHTNEDVARPYNFREFGCGRQSPKDDFSSDMVTASSRAFTLDDGTTTLVGNNYITLSTGYGEFICPNSGTGDYISFTFVGTGLDIVNPRGATSTMAFTLTIDGTAILTNTVFGGTGLKNVLKIASGLPYGTHTFKMLATSTGVSCGVSQFIVYQPKKPTLPATALELCDYNVMANYSAASSTDPMVVPSGCLRKNNMRELAYVGTWGVPAIDPANPSGFSTYSNTASAYCQLMYFGLGVELLGYVDTSALNYTVSIDDSSVLTGSTLIQPGSGLTWTASTGTLTGTSSVGGRIRIIIPISTLSSHKVKIFINSGHYVYPLGFDLVTPIHSYKSNLYADLQNTLTVGSNSLMDSRKTSMIKEALPAQKAWVQALGVANSPTTTSTALIPCPDMSVTIKTNGSAIKVDLSLNVIFAASAELDWCLYVDGALFVPMRSVAPITTGYFIYSESLIIPVSQGVHKVDLYWASGGGQTLTLRGSQRILTVQEL